MNIPAIHGDKLKALLTNNKLPVSDKQKVHDAIEKYHIWRNLLLQLKGDYNIVVSKSVDLLNDYKNYIEIDLIFESKEDFLYRQRGQLKLDNTILEEFLPLLVNNIFNTKIEEKNIILGPTSCISGIRFDSSLAVETSG